MFLQLTDAQDSQEHHVDDQLPEGGLHVQFWILIHIFSVLGHPDRCKEEELTLSSGQALLQRANPDLVSLLTHTSMISYRDHNCIFSTLLS